MRSSRCFLLGIAAALSQSPSPTSAQESADKKTWLAVAPGRVEPLSGEIKIGSPVMGRVGEVLVKVGDKVFAGEALVQRRRRRGPDCATRRRRLKSICTSVRAPLRRARPPTAESSRTTLPIPSERSPRRGKLSIRRQLRNAAARAATTILPRRAPH